MQHFLIGSVDLFLTDNDSYEGDNGPCLAVVARMLAVLRCLGEGVDLNHVSLSVQSAGMEGDQRLTLCVRRLSATSACSLSCTCNPSLSRSGDLTRTQTVAQDGKHPTPREPEAQSPRSSPGYVSDSPCPFPPSSPHHPFPLAPKLRPTLYQDPQPSTQT